MDIDPPALLPWSEGCWLPRCSQSRAARAERSLEDSKSRPAGRHRQGWGHIPRKFGRFPPTPQTWCIRFWVIGRLSHAKGPWIKYRSTKTNIMVNLLHRNIFGFPSALQLQLYVDLSIIMSWRSWFRLLRSPDWRQLLNRWLQSSNP